MTKQEVLEMYNNISDNSGTFIRYISDDARWWIRAPVGVDLASSSVLIHGCSKSEHWQTVEKKDKMGKTYLECSNCKTKPDSDLTALYYLIRER